MIQDFYLDSHQLWILRTDPLALGAFVASRSFDRTTQTFRWPTNPNGILKTAYAFLAIYATSWLSHRWRNGLIAPRRLNNSTWRRELVLITGGAAGIAKSMSEKLAAKGANVAVVDITPYQPTHANIKAYQCDISSFEDLSRVKALIEKDFGQAVTMICNVAGLNNKSLILDLDERRVSKMIDVNLKSRECRCAREKGLNMR